MILTTFSSRIFWVFCKSGWDRFTSRIPQRDWCLTAPALTVQKTTASTHGRSTEDITELGSHSLGRLFPGCGDLQQSTRPPFILNWIVCTLPTWHTDVLDKWGPAYFILKQCSLLPHSMGHATMCPFQIPIPDK